LAEPTAWRLSVIMKHITSSVEVCSIGIVNLQRRCRHAGSDRNRASKLPCRDQVSPEQRTTDDFLRHDNNIARIELR
jgi:hypothetical protein